MIIKNYDYSLREHIELFESLNMIRSSIQSSVAMLFNSLNQGNKVLLCGNGGSAADAQHFATELTVRFEKSRRGYPAISLATDTSALTAITNDFGAERMFSRQVEALANEGDVLVAISTSGNSINVLNAVQQAKSMGVNTIGLLGSNGGLILPHVDCPIVVPSNRTARVQEAHVFILHAICEAIDNGTISP